MLWYACVRKNPPGLALADGSRWYRGFPKRKIPEYWAAQFLGALIAGFVAYALYSASIHNYLASNSETDIIDSFVTSQRHPWITPGIAFFNECMGTSVTKTSSSLNAS